MKIAKKLLLVISYIIYLLSFVKRRKEIIFALSATIEGDTTGYYIFKKMKNKEDLVISTIAKGISIGNDLEYTDELTLGRSIVNRVKFSFND